MQLPLPVSLPTDETFSSFVAGENAELVSTLQSTAIAISNEEPTSNFVEKQQAPVVNIIGPAGSGKSHLLYAVCHQLAANDIVNLYLNLNDYHSWSPDIFDSLEHLPLICLDNVHSIAGVGEWEEALFDLINRISESKKTVLILTSRLGANHPSFVLPDLRSRLGWGITYQLLTLSDEQKSEVIKTKLTQKGLTLSNQALQFLLHHSARDMPNLMSLIERLDQRSLQEQKRLTVSLVKRELGLE